MAILTDGSPWTYGEAISSVVTQQAQALMPGGRIDDPADHNPVLSAVAVTASGNTVQLTGTAVDPDAPSVALSVRVSEGGHPVARPRRPQRPADSTSTSPHRTARIPTR